MVPSSFQPATWRGTTAADATGLGISFDLPNGEIIRLKLSVDAACGLRDSLADYLPADVTAHSESSSGSPSLDVSPQLAGNV
jgi:hypothetical protein